jgi:hypothetical protein
MVVGGGSIAALDACTSTAQKGPRGIPSFKAAATAAPPDCPALTGTGVYDTTLSPSSGPPGTTVTVSGALPVVSENGVDVGQTSTKVDVYWNLDFDKWWSVLEGSPLASVAGSPVTFLGTQDVAKLCIYQVRVEIPSVPPGTYPIEVLYEGPDLGGPSGASFAPVDFQVTAG